MSCQPTTSSQIMLPVLLLSFAFAGFLGSQAWMMAADRDLLNQAYTQRDKALEQVSKVKAQVNALAKGTLELAKQGDKNAQTIIDEMKKAGINVQDAPAQQAGAARMPTPPAPAAQ